MSNNFRAIRLRRVCDLTGMSRATVWRLSKSDPDFPKPFYLSEGITVWDEQEIFDWLARKKAETRKKIWIITDPTGEKAGAKLVEMLAKRANRQKGKRA